MHPLEMCKRVYSVFFYCTAQDEDIWNRDGSNSINHNTRHKCQDTKSIGRKRCWSMSIWEIPPEEERKYLTQHSLMNTFSVVPPWGRNDISHQFENNNDPNIKSIITPQVIQKTGWTGILLQNTQREYKQYYLYIKYTLNLQQKNMHTMWPQAPYHKNYNEMKRMIQIMSRNRVKPNPSQPGTKIETNNGICKYMQWRI